MDQRMKCRLRAAKTSPLQPKDILELRTPLNTVFIEVERPDAHARNTIGEHPHSGVGMQGLVGGHLT